MREYKLLKFDEKELITKAKKEEQERIIKLLEENLAFDLDIGICDPESNCQLEPNHIIYLIKGEQK